LSTSTVVIVMAGQPPKLANEMRALPLPPAVLERWLWRNAAEELGL
jgi:predicted TIM-barrel fold metal-dependent hydrolase